MTCTHVGEIVYCGARKAAHENAVYLQRNWTTVSSILCPALAYVWPALETQMMETGMRAYARKISLPDHPG